MAKKEPLKSDTMENKNKIQYTESEIEGGNVIETTKPQRENISDEKVKVRRHKFDSLTIYEVSESELATIEKGSPTSIYLNFAIFLLSMAGSFLTALMTNNYTEKQNVYIVFLLMTIVGFIIGILLIILWLRTKNDFDIAIKKIKDRVS